MFFLPREYNAKSLLPLLCYTIFSKSYSMSSYSIIKKQIYTYFLIITHYLREKNFTFQMFNSGIMILGKIEKLKRRSQSTYTCDVRCVLLCKQWFYDDIRYNHHHILGHVYVYDSVVFIQCIYQILISISYYQYTCICLYKYMQM